MAQTLLNETTETYAERPQKWMTLMALYEMAELAAQVNALDQETARRVARLVLECNASLQLALSAVQDANSSKQGCTVKQLAARDRFARVIQWMRA